MAVNASTLSAGSVFMPKDAITAFDNLISTTLKHNMSVGRGNCHKIVKRDKLRLIVGCFGLNSKNDKCQFIINAHKHGDDMARITSININHTCVTTTRDRNVKCNVLADAGTSALSTFVPSTVLRSGDSQQLQKMVKAETGMELGYGVCNRIVSEKKSDPNLVGIGQFSYLHSYMSKLQESDPAGSYDIVDTNNVFKCLYVAPSCCMSMWPKTRNVATVDGAHCSSIVGGILLSFCVKDSNNQVMILAFAFAEAENTESYNYFYEHLRRDFPGPLLIIADGDKGCAAGLRSWPAATLSRCLRHKLVNYHTAHPTHHVHSPPIRKHIYIAARTCSMFAWKMQLDTLKAMGEGGEAIAKWMEEIRPSIHSFEFVQAGLSRFGETTNNNSEQFNAAVKVPRTQPVMTMIKSLLRWIFDRFFERRREAEAWVEKKKIFTPSAEALLTIKRDRARDYSVRLVDISATIVRAVAISSTTTFEYNVTMDQSGAMPCLNCPCGRLAEYYMPCVHVIAVFFKLEKCKGEQYRAWSLHEAKWYTDRAYLVTGYLDQYSAPTSHTQVTSLEEDGLVPWEIRAKPGRKRVQRFKSAPPEKHRKYECMSCGGEGHYSSTCRHPNRDKLVTLAESSKSKVAQTILYIDDE